MFGVLLGLVSASITFVSPACGGTVSGTVELAVSASPPAAQVTFAMGSHQIGAASVPRFLVSWNSGEAMDGVSAIQAVARDAFGNELGSAECLVQVSNRQAALVVNSPNLSHVLSGVVQISVTGSDALAFPSVWTLNVDGEWQQTMWTDSSWKSPNTVSFQLDTTRFTNGPHEIDISMDSRTGLEQPQWMNWRGMVNRVADFENGTAWMDLIPGYQSLHLAPGQQIVLGCRRLYTDGSSGDCGSPSYQAADASIAQADAATGAITGGNPGFTLVTVTDGSKSATARVWVAADSQVPHFTAGLFVIAPFFLDPDLLQQSVSLQEEVKRAGVNTLGHGLYLNPRDVTLDFSEWKNDFDATILPKMQWATDNGFHLLPTGDDIFRRIGMDAWYTLNWPAGQQAVQYAASALAAAGVGIGIEAIDEASMMWGPRPSPEGHAGQASYLFDGIECQSGACSADWNDAPFASGWNFAFQGATVAGLNTPPGSLFSVQSLTPAGFRFQAAGPVTGTFDAATSPNLEYLWFAGNYCANSTPCNPPVPNNALAIMRGWLKAAQNSVPIAFPPLASDSPQTHGNWMGPGGVSDYASHYFTSLKVRTTYPWSEGIQEGTSAMEAEFFSRQPYLMLDRPQLMLVSLAGPSYTKNGPDAGTYLPGPDALTQPGVSPEHVSALMMDAAALGGAGIRLYFFEPADDLPGRAQSAAGTAFQTGANPLNLQVESWQAMGFAANLLTQVLQPYLLGAALNSLAYGRNLTSAARHSPDGNMLLIVNGNDWGRAIHVDFESYQLGFGAARYRLSASRIATDALPAGQNGDTLTLASGESVAYIFPNCAAAMPLVKTILTRHRPGDDGVQYAYIYPNRLSQGAVVKCANPCSIWRDPRLGGFVYQDVPSGRANSRF